MLAFAFIATIGIQGMVTRVPDQTRSASTSTRTASWLYEMPGLVLPYLYFQVPLMVITFLPALEGLKPQWAEANATLGGTRFTYWTRIGLPGAGARRSSAACCCCSPTPSRRTRPPPPSSARARRSCRCRSARALSSETVLGHENIAGALALGMIVVMVVVMSGYSLLSDAPRGGSDERRTGARRSGPRSRRGARDGVDRSVVVGAPLRRADRRDGRVLAAQRARRRGSRPRATGRRLFDPENARTYRQPRSRRSATRSCSPS